MDAATAAAMSDPERNPAFRRRWREALDESAAPQRPVHEPATSIERTGRELLDQWRQDRARRVAPP